MTKKSLAEFTDQYELAKVYEKYDAAYNALHPDKTPWPKFNDFQVLKSIDNVGVYYTPETTLFTDNVAAHMQQSTVAKNIGARLLDCAAYFLAQNIPTENVPDTLRLCLAVCHNNVHWTGIIATFDSFQQAYAELFAAWNQEDSSYRESSDECVLHNRAKNTIYKHLQIILEPCDLATRQDEQTQKIVNFFRKEQPILIEHYDSLNSDSYTTRIEHSLHSISSHSELKHRHCSQQTGNTCGDHTTINLFVSGMMNTVPMINEAKTTLTSQQLRDITNDTTDLIDKAKTILHSINISVQPTLTTEGIDLSVTYIKMANKVYDLINEFHALIPEATTNMIQQAICKAKAAPTMPKATFLSVKKQKDIFDNLVTLFKAKEFRDEAPSYSALFILIAQDYCAEIEYQQGLKSKKTQAEVSELPLMSTELNSRKTKLDLILSDLAKKISAPDQHHSKKAKDAAESLLTNLKQATKSYLETFSQDPNASNDTFKKECEDCVQTAKQELGKDLGWCTYLTNLLKKIANAIILVTSFGQVNNFFNQKRAKSIEAVESAEKELALINPTGPINT